MSTERLETTSAALRRAFDGSFAQARGRDAVVLENLLAIRVGGARYAVRVSEIAGVQADRKVVPLPSRTPELLGLVAFRAAMAPAYDLRRLLGHVGGPVPRWLLLVRSPDLVGLAFDLFETHIRTNAGSISSADDGGRVSPYVRGIVRTTDGVLPLIHIASVIEAITRLASSDKPAKEQ